MIQENKLCDAKLLVSSNKTAIIDYNTAFTIAVEHNYFKICKWLIKMKADPTIKCNYSFAKAAALNNFKITKWLISLNKKNYLINPSDNNNNAFRWAIINGHLKMAKWLISLNKHGYLINPSAKNNEALRWSIRLSNIEIIKFLISIIDIIPSDLKYYNEQVKLLVENEINNRNNILNTLQEILPVPYGISETIYLYLYNSYDVEYQKEYEKIIFKNQK